MMARSSGSGWHGAPVWAYRVIALVLAMGSASAQAPGDLRLALVIGNAAYPGPAALANPVNDAKAMGDTLRGLGFDVIELRDGTRAQMQQAITRVRDGLKGKQGIAMLYYAGHGLQVDWRNYMVPVDAQLASADDVPARTVDLSQVIDAFTSAGTRMNILVLDACRDNPFKQASTNKGLAQMDAPPSTILAYATAPGNVAEDGGGDNGLYTRFLLQELVKPQSKIEDVFKRTRFAVRRASQGRQIPWESTSLEDDFMFNAGKVVAAPRPDTREREQAFNHQFVNWEAIKNSNAVEDFYAFLARYPSGNFAEMAQVRLDRLQKAHVAAAPDRQGRVPTSYEARYRDGDTYELETKDGLTGAVLVRGTIQSRFRGDDEVEAVVLSGNAVPGRATRAGFAIDDGASTYDPPWVLQPAGDFQQGKRISGRTMRTERSGRRYWVDYETKVIGLETIQTAFGPIEAWKVETKMLNQLGGRLSLLFWYDPEWGYPLRLRSESRTDRGPPDIRIRDMIARSRKS
jgi:hypothetical protein